MYITISKNPKGIFEIKQTALNKMIKNSIKKVHNFEQIKVFTEIYEETLLYIIIQLSFEDKTNIVWKNDEIVSIIDNLMIDNLNIKPKNINITYMN